jgi:hypothetical protein
MVAPRSRPPPSCRCSRRREKVAPICQALGVQIDRPGADRAAARHRDARFAHAGQRGPRQSRCAHLANDVVGRPVLVIEPPSDSVRPSLPTGSTAMPC